MHRIIVVVGVERLISQTYDCCIFVLVAALSCCMRVLVFHNVASRDRTALSATGAFVVVCLCVL